MYIFDLDGTITDTNGLWAEVDREFLTRRGLTPTAEYQRVVERSIYPIAAQFTREYYRLPESREDIMAEWDALADRHYRELAPLKPGAEAFLRQCAAEGRPMALFTACRPALCRIVLDRFQLTDLFPRVIYAEEIGLEKRDPRAFTALAGQLGAAPEECVLFDDSPRSCRAAKDTGLQVVGVRDSFFAAAEEEVRAGCHRYIRSFSELLGDAS